MPIPTINTEEPNLLMSAIKDYYDNQHRLLAIKRFVAPIRNDEAAYITEKVTSTGERIYSLELIKMGVIGDKLKEITEAVNSSHRQAQPNIETP
jgi:hypothetical protein